MMDCSRITLPFDAEIHNSFNTPEKIWKVQATLLKLQRVLPVVGMIPAAIQIIVSLGEIIASRLADDQYKDCLLREGVLVLGFSTLNLMSMGLFFPILGVSTACKTPSRREVQ